MTDHRELLQQALEALEQIKCSIFHPAKVFPCNSAIIALRAALAEPEPTVKESLTAPQRCEYIRSSGTTHWCALAEAGPRREWVDLLKDAEQIVRSKELRKKFIDGTPLANDIPVWMADFAHSQIYPLRREWVGLTPEELHLGEARSAEEIAYARAIEAKLKEKNNA
jgi:hypothetical protein